MVEIKSYPAENGDAFLIRATNAHFAMLVDGGYARTFQQHLRQDLKALAAGGYDLNLVIATHIDADHISGLLAFFRVNGRYEAPTVIRVHEVLHNSLRGLIAPGKGPTPLQAGDAELVEEIRSRGYPPSTPYEEPGQVISARQGLSLAQLLKQGGYRWNTGDGSLVVGEDGLTRLDEPKARIQILGPCRERLEELRRWWEREIRRLGMIGSLTDFDDIFEFLCAHEMSGPGVRTIASSDGELTQVYWPDDSVTNGSSIALSVEIENRRLLLLGDAWAEDMVAALRSSGPKVFDAIKLSHHGSLRNTSPALLALIDSPHFFISTNGDGHAHPDIAVLKAIVERPASFKRTLHFNYSTSASRQLRSYTNKCGANFTVEEGIFNWVQLSDRELP